MIELGSLVSGAFQKLKSALNACPEKRMVEACSRQALTGIDWR
jgi:hypothetical protein